MIAPDRSRALQRIGILSGFAAGAWLGAAEAPAKLVTLGIPPILLSLIMVMGVFLARWSVPALLQGTGAIRFDVRKAPHLVLWAVVAGILWAIANTLTIYAIRDIGLSIAFPLWNSNSLLGVVWGVLLFRELHGATRARWLAVVGGSLAMVAGGTLLALASAAHTTPEHAARGLIAALTAGLLWGTMYIPYRKAYLTGMSPLSFITFFSIGELATMLILALWFTGGPASLVHGLVNARAVIFWIMLGGFVWVIGDLFQQYAAKYIGISRGIPLSNTNQLWGLLWGVAVFGEFSGDDATLARVIAGSIIMALGAAAIAFATATTREQEQWKSAAQRESNRYGVDPDYVAAAMAGDKTNQEKSGRRSGVDIAIAVFATSIFIFFALYAEAPKLAWNPPAAVAVIAVTLVILAAAARALWRATRFN